jgi:PAS domain S-box-containing protein
MTSRPASGAAPRVDEDIDSPLAWEPSLAFLRYAIWFILAGSAAYITGLRIFAPAQTVRPLVVLLLLLLSGAAWFFLARGKVHATVRTLAIGIWAYITVTSLMLGGVSAAAVIIYPLIILMAGWLIGTQTAVGIAVVTTVATLAFAILESLRLLPTPPPTPPILRWVVQCGVFLLSALLIVHVVRSYRHRLADLRKLDRALAQRTADLEAREADLLRAQAVAHVGSWEYELAADNMHLSAETCRIFGLPAGTVGSHDTYLSRVHPEDRGAVDAAWQVALQGGARFDNEHRILVGESTRWVRQIAELQRDAEGKPRRSVGTTEDITERKRAEQSLRESEAQLQCILASTADGLLAVSQQGRVIQTNRRFAVLWRIPQSLLDGRDDQALLAYVLDQLSDPEAFLRKVQELYQSDAEFTDTVGFKDGRVFERFTSPLLLNGSNVGRVWSFRDITERRRAESALVESRNLLQAIIDTVPVRVFWKDRNLRYLGCNPAFAQDAGKSGPEEIIGKDDHQLGWVDDADRYRSDDLAVLESGVARLAYDEPQTTPGGQTIWLRTSKVPLTSRDNESMGVVGIYEDITERKRIEAETAALEEQLQQARKMESVGRLAGGVAHDFNNMLSVILGHAELALLQTDPAQPLRTDLEEIRKTATRSADLTRQLLAFARKQRIAPTVLDLNATVAVMLAMLQRLIGENIQILWQPAADLWPVRMDPSQLDQILTNLCVNARDAIAGNGHLTIDTSNREMDHADCARHVGMVPGDYVRLAVRDDGCGIDKDTLARLFEPFFTTKEFGQGAGLGLASVYGAVKQNGGFIDVESTPGQGTTFTIYLHRHVGSAEQSRTEAAVAPLLHGSETILLVEDESAILTMATAMLERHGYTVLAAATPEAALRIARAYSGRVHLLLTDVVMPNMNGAELARHVLALDPDVKRLYMSGYTADVIAHHGVVGQGADFIQKPFGMRDLAARIREVLDQKQA